MHIKKNPLAKWYFFFGNLPGKSSIFITFDECSLRIGSQLSTENILYFYRCFTISGIRRNNADSILS